jgi:hypothetical protein
VIHITRKGLGYHCFVPGSRSSYRQQGTKAKGGRHGQTRFHVHGVAHIELGYFHALGGLSQPSALEEKD